MAHFSWESDIHCFSCGAELTEDYADTFINALLKYDEEFVADEEQFENVQIKCPTCTQASLKHDLESICNKTLLRIRNTDTSETVKKQSVKAILSIYNTQLKVFGDIVLKYGNSEKVAPKPASMPPPLLVKKPKPVEDFKDPDNYPLPPTFDERRYVEEQAMEYGRAIQKKRKDDQRKKQLEEQNSPVEGED